MACEFICIDDGSADRTWELLRAQHECDARWRCLSLSRNFGHQTAVSAGLFHARGDAVVIIDADLQDRPEEIARMIDTVARRLSGYFRGACDPRGSTAQKSAGVGFLQTDRPTRLVQDTGRRRGFLPAGSARHRTS